MFDPDPVNLYYLPFYRTGVGLVGDGPSWIWSGGENDVELGDDGEFS